jgi:hypothetical protein
VFFFYTGGLADSTGAAYTKFLFLRALFGATFLEAIISSSDASSSSLPNNALFGFACGFCYAGAGVETGLGFVIGSSLSSELMRAFFFGASCFF